MTIKRIRRAIRAGRYEYTIHALQEADADDLTEADVRRVLLRGELVMTLIDDPRGPRFVMQSEEIEVICRFLPSGRLRIITVYAAEEQRWM